MCGQSPPMPLGVSMVEALLITLSAPLLVLVALWGAMCRKLRLAMCSKPAVCRGCCLQRIKGKPFSASTAFFRPYPVRRQRHSVSLPAAPQAFCVMLKFLQHQAAIKRTFSMIIYRKPSPLHFASKIAARPESGVTVYFVHSGIRAGTGAFQSQRLGSNRPYQLLAGRTQRNFAICR